MSALQINRERKYESKITANGDIPMMYKVDVIIFYEILREMFWSIVPYARLYSVFARQNYKYSYKRCFTERLSVKTPCFVVVSS